MATLRFFIYLTMYMSIAYCYYGQLLYSRKWSCPHNVCMYCDCYKTKCYSSNDERQFERCYKNLFLSSTEAWKLLRNIYNHQCATLKDYKSFGKKDCPECFPKRSGSEYRYRPGSLGRTLIHSQTLSSAPDGEAQDGFRGSCCETQQPKRGYSANTGKTQSPWETRKYAASKNVWEAIAPITIQAADGTLYTVKHLEDQYQIFFIGKCRGHGLMCGNGGTCIEETNYPTWILVRDPDSGGVKYILFTYPRHCYCVKGGT